MKTRINPTRSFALVGAISAMALHAAPASACGGFFCSPASPVNQAAERIVFAHNGEKVTQIVEVMYEGDAEDFAWVLPVPGTPEPGVSSVQALDRLQAATNPTYRTNDNLPESCSLLESSNDSGPPISSPGGSAEEGGEVVVLDAGQVGPFDFETIAVVGDVSDPATLATDWLDDNGYDVGDRAAETLGPYLANGLNLIAFRLQKGKETGSIRPISLRYDANAVSIPIIPTSVAANDDMPILVWVLGESRAIPTNYRGLEINELLIDWFNPNDTYNAVVTAAANEAGGQGFVTEMAFPAAPYADRIHRDWENVEQIVSAGADIQGALSSLTGQFGTWDGYVDAVEEGLTLRSGITPEKFIECVSCYFNPENAGVDGFGGAGGVGEPIKDDDPIWDTDLVAFGAIVDEKVIDPIRETASLFEDHKYVTRLYTTMSADEMSRDPTFKFNPDLEDVDNAHVAERDFRSCDGADGGWVVTLPDGQKVYGSGNDWPHALDSSDMNANVRVLQYSTSGPPEVINDYRTEILSRHRNSDAGKRPASWSEPGGGCSVVPVDEKRSPLSPWLLLAGFGLSGAFFARRRVNRS